MKKAEREAQHRRIAERFLRGEDVKDISAAEGLSASRLYQAIPETVAKLIKHAWDGMGYLIPGMEGVGLYEIRYHFAEVKRHRAAINAFLESGAEVRVENPQRFMERRFMRWNGTQGWTDEEVAQEMGRLSALGWRIVGVGERDAASKWDYDQGRRLVVWLQRDAPSLAT